MSLLQELKKDIEARFGNQQEFSSRYFYDIAKKYPNHRVSNALLGLVRNNFIRVLRKDRVSNNKNGSHDMNIYVINKKVSVQVCEPSPGIETIWHTKPPVNVCKDGEVYRIKFWDNREGHMAWRSGTWWTYEGKHFGAAWIKEWRGVTR